MQVLQCNSYAYMDSDPRQYNSQLIVSMPYKGLLHYEQYNINYAMNLFFNGASVQEVSFEAGVYKFKLTNIQLNQINVDNIVLQYPAQEQDPIFQQAIFNNMELSFEFEVQNDKGTGKILTKEILLEFYATLGLGEPNDCYNYTYLDLQIVDNTLQFFLTDIDIKFDSEFSYIYDGIFDLFKNIILDVMNTKIFPPILQQAIQAGLEECSDMSCASHPYNEGSNVNIVTGNYWRDIGINSTTLIAKFNGQLYFKGDNSKIFGDSLNYSEPKTNYITNDDVVYYLGLPNFQQTVYWALNQTFNQSNFTNTINVTYNDIEFLQLTKTCGILRIFDVIYQINYQTIFYIENKNVQNVHLTTTLGKQLGCYSQDKQIIIDDMTCMSEQIQDFVEQYFKPNYDSIVLTWYNSYGMDECHVIYIENDVMLIGCNFQDYIE